MRFRMSSLNSAKEINKYLNLDDDNENEEQKIKLEINENASDNEDAEDVDANADAEDADANVSDNEDAEDNGLVKNIEKFEKELAQQNPMNAVSNGINTIRKYFDTRSLKDDVRDNEDENESANENTRNKKHYSSRRTVKRNRAKHDNDFEYNSNSLIGKLKRLAETTDGNIEMKIKVTRKGNRNKNDKNKTKKHYWSSAKTNELLRRPRIKISTRNKNKYPGRVRNLNGNITRTYKKYRSRSRSRSRSSPRRKNGNDWLLRQKLGMS